jgi:imidazolonepropionase-like amidohydrolase
MPIEEPSKHPISALSRVPDAATRPLRSLVATASLLLVTAVGAGHPDLFRPAPLQALQAPASQDALVLVIRNGNLVDVVNGSVREGVSVVVEGRTVRSVEGAEFQPPAGARVIDVEGRWILPGFIDAHTHIRTLDAARRALHSGVTTVRSSSVDAFQDVGIRELVRAGVLPGPDMVAAGIFVTQDLGQAILADPRLIPLADGVETHEQLRLLVQVNAERGVDVIKTRGTERAGLPETDPRQQVYDEEQLRTVVDEAARHGISVQAHAHGDEGARAAVLAGVRSIEHGTYLSRETLELMRERGTYLVPTYSTVVDLTQPGGDYDDPVLRVRGSHMLPRLAETVRTAHELGVPIATGADTGYGPEGLLRISHEVVRFVELGMTPLEALRSATIVGARLLELDQVTGSVEPGKEADLVVVERNPLDDIRSVEDVLVVVSNGQVAVNRLPFGVGPR